VTFTEPFALNVPTPGMFTEVALVVVQLSVVLEPLLILIGCAVSTMLGAEFPEVVCELPPPQPMPAIRAENSNKRVKRRGTADINGSNSKEN